MAVPLTAQAQLELRLSESDGETLLIEAHGRGFKESCGNADGQLFGKNSGSIKTSEDRYVQPLNSEAGDEAHYLKAARMGGGIYIHLPYFFPAGPCKDVLIVVKARHILWDGTWYADRIELSRKLAQHKSLFLTNELRPVLRGGTYFDASIPAPTLSKLEARFATILAFYRDVLKFEPMKNVGAVVAIVRNNGNYTGFGGDALNIIRMSYDNPSPQDLLTIDQIFPATFAHELSHKLQSERLFAMPLARHIVEGSADFLKMLVLHSSGILDAVETRERVLKAAAACANAADTRSWSQKTEQGAIRFREPYDCGMTYYFVAYYSSGMTATDFTAALRKAVTGISEYVENPQTLCLLFEASCENERLKTMVSNKSSYVRQTVWLEGKLHSVPVLGR